MLSGTITHIIVQLLCNQLTNILVNVVQNGRN